MMHTLKSAEKIISPILLLLTHPTIFASFLLGLVSLSSLTGQVLLPYCIMVQQLAHSNLHLAPNSKHLIENKGNKCINSLYPQINLAKTLSIALPLAPMKSPR